MQTLAAPMIAVVLAAAASPALAADQAQVEARYSGAFKACLDRASSTFDQIECAGAEYALQDRALNAAYQRALGKLTPGQQTKLKAAQRTWISWRDANCRSMEDIAWGSLSRVSANLCMVNMTIERTIELEAYPPYE